jgi:hypothetical protein
MNRKAGMIKKPITNNIPRVNTFFQFFDEYLAASVVKYPISIPLPLHLIKRNFTAILI